MQKDNECFEWTERGFLYDQGLASYELLVDGIGPREHRIRGQMRAHVRATLNIAAHGDQVCIDADFDSPEERAEAVAVITCLRDALTRMLAAIDDAEAFVQPHWEAEK